MSFLLNFVGVWGWGLGVWGWGQGCVLLAALRKTDSWNFQDRSDIVQGTISKIGWLYFLLFVRLRLVCVTGLVVCTLGVLLVWRENVAGEKGSLSVVTSHKTHNTPDKYSTMHNFVTESYNVVHCGIWDWRSVGFGQQNTVDAMTHPCLRYLLLVPFLTSSIMPVIIDIA